MIGPPPSSIKEWSWPWIEWLNLVYEKLRGPLWYDMLAPVNTARTAASAPTLGNFGPDSITQQYEFNRGEGILIGFHVNHDIKPGSKIYPHVHWSTDGTSSGNVEWVIEWIVAKGHQQEEFAAGATSPISLVQTANAAAWHHHIVEATDAQAFEAPEVDSLILMRVTRGSTNDTYSNLTSGHVFGLYIDLHYQRDRFGTPGKSPDFYKR